MNYFWAFLASYVSVFLKGFQHKNVINDLYWATIITSYGMGVVDVLLIHLISKSGWDVAFVTATGASLGMMTSMYIHNRFMKRKRDVLDSDKT